MTILFITYFILFFIYMARAESISLLLRPLLGQLYQTLMIDDYDGSDCRGICSMNDWQGKRKCSEKTCRSASLSTINATLLDPGSNLGLCGEKQTNNHQCYGTVTVTSYLTELARLTQVFSSFKWNGLISVCYGILDPRISETLTACVGATLSLIYTSLCAL
jgi:hypothetical protein